ncbi:MAG: tetratricopeptide repeat protein [Thermodesulfobacteriota bacterium]
MNKFHLFKSFFLAAFILTTLAACEPGPSTKIFNEAELHLSRGEYLEAIKKHTELINRYPASPLAPESLFKKGHIYYRYLSEIEMAVKTYNELAYLYPESPKLANAAIDKGEIYSALGEHWKAVKEYEWLLKNAGSGEGEAYRYLIAMEYFKMNDFRQARIEFAEIVQKSGASELLPEIHFRVATSYYLEGKLPESLTAYKLVIKLFPDHPLAHESKVNISQVHADAGRLNEALVELKKLKRDGGHPDPELIDMRIKLLEERIKRPGQKKKRKKR